MTKELRQGLGLLVVAAAIGLLWIAVGGDVPVIGGAALLFALGGLFVVAVGLFRGDDG